jgi:hypothetical protein
MTDVIWVGERVKWGDWLRAAEKPHGVQLL